MVSSPGIYAAELHAFACLYGHNSLQRTRQLGGLLVRHLCRKASVGIQVRQSVHPCLALSQIHLDCDLASCLPCFSRFQWALHRVSFVQGRLEAANTACLTLPHPVSFSCVACADFQRLVSSERCHFENVVLTAAVRGQLRPQ
jgi:hypothetical protein